MGLRTSSKPELGAMSGVFRDLEWLATSQQTFSQIQKAIKSTGSNFLCLDEIEIGCSLETIAGITKWLNENLRSGIEGSLGCLVITHSPYVVNHLDYDHWFNMDGYDNSEEWIDREVEPVDIEKFMEEQTELFTYIRDRMNQGKEGNK